MTGALDLGFIPLVDAAPLIIARELGFAREEGLSLTLHRAASWSMLRDMLDFGQVAAAQMLSVVPVARALGLGGGSVPLEAPMVLSMNGQMLGASPDLIGRLLVLQPDLGFGEAPALATALAALRQPVRVGVPFPFSMHAELLHYLLRAARPQTDVIIRTVPPPAMAAALAAGEIDAFCVGEPWGSHAVGTAGASLLLPGAGIWSQAPEKLLVTRTGWCEANPDLAGRLIRAVWRACRWVGDPANRLMAAEILSRPAHLDLPPDLIDRALTGQFQVAPDGTDAHVDQFLSFHPGAATFPWRSQAAWIGARLAARFGLDPAGAMARARATFRSDLYRRHLGPAGAELPLSSDKAEGLLTAPATVPAVRGTLQLARNQFFDGAIFDPAASGC